MKKVQFGAKPGMQSQSRAADQWVAGKPVGIGGGGEPMKRLTIDVPLSLHKRIKTQCAIQELVMADVIREMLDRRFPEEDRGEAESSVSEQAASS